MTAPLATLSYGNGHPRHGYRLLADSFCMDFRRTAQREALLKRLIQGRSFPGPAAAVQATQPQVSNDRCRRVVLRSLLVVSLFVPMRVRSTQKLDYRENERWLRFASSDQCRLPLKIRRDGYIQHEASCIFNLTLKCTAWSKAEMASS